MSLSQGRTAGFGHPDITEFSFLNQFAEGPSRLLNRNLGVDSSALKEIQFLGSPEVLIDVVDAAPEVVLPANLLSYSPEEVRR